MSMFIFDVYNFFKECIQFYTLNTFIVHKFSKNVHNSVHFSLLCTLNVYIKLRCTQLFIEYSEFYAPNVHI